MTYPQVWFVAGPSEDADVRLDLNNAMGLATLRVEHAGFTLGAPPLLGEPDSVSAALGLREPSWNQQIRGPKPAAEAVRSALSRELLRSTNWVRVQLAETSPAFYLRTYRGAFGELSLEFVKKESGSDVWRLPVALAAEPYLYGKRVTHDPVTVTPALSDPSPLRIALPEIQGDAVTGLRVRVTPDGANDTSASWLVGVVSTTNEDPVGVMLDVGIGDDWTPSAFADDGTSDSTALGGSVRIVTLDSGLGEGTVTVLSQTMAASPPMGRHKAVMRCRFSPVDVDNGKTLYFRFGQALNGDVDSGDLRHGPLVSVATPEADGHGGDFVAFEGWVDLGEFTFPFAGAVPDGDSPTPQPPTVFLAMHRPVGGVTDVVKIDAVLLIPIDGPDVTQATMMETHTEVLYGKRASKLDGSMTFTWDADSELIYKHDVSSGELLDLPGFTGGGFPAADPVASQNTLFVFPMTNGGDFFDSGTAVDATWTVEVSYQPKKLHI